MTDFPVTWRARVLPGPPLIQPARSYLFPERIPGEEETLARGALRLEVQPATGGTFLATCSLGFEDPSLPTGVWSCPRPECLLALAGGYGYLVDTEAPEQTRLLPLRPITAVLPAPAEKLLLLAGFHHVLALDAQGIAWQTARLSWDGVTLSRTAPGVLHGTGWDMFADREVPFTVDLRTGEHIGGGFHPRT